MKIPCRQIPGFPVYGMGQPKEEGFTQLAEKLPKERFFTVPQSYCTYIIEEGKGKSSVSMSWGELAHLYVLYTIIGSVGVNIKADSHRHENII
jgi:hypothetical protein